MLSIIGRRILDQKTARLLDLPDEILVEITAHISYIDLEAIAASYDRFQVLTADELDGVRERYRVVHTADDDQDHMNAWTFLAETLRKGAGALTKEHILMNTFARHKDECDANTDTDGSHDSCRRDIRIQMHVSSEDGAAVLPHVQELLEFHAGLEDRGAESSRSLSEEVLEGDTEITMMLVLPLLTSLRILRLSLRIIAQYDSNRDTGFLEWVCNVANASRDADIGNGAYPLSILEIVYFEPGEDDYGNREYAEDRVLSGAAPFLALPSVRKAVIVSPYCYMFTIPIPLPKSRARAVFIEQGKLTEQMGKLLMETFEGSCDVFQTSGGEPLNPPWTASVRETHLHDGGMLTRLSLGRRILLREVRRTRSPTGLGRISVVISRRCLSCLLIIIRRNDVFSFRVAASASSLMRAVFRERRLIGSRGFNFIVK